MVVGRLMLGPVASCRWHAAAVLEPVRGRPPGTTDVRQALALLQPAESERETASGAASTVTQATAGGTVRSHW